jgi:hypothetical protein
MMPFGDDDDDEERDNVLKGLGDEVDDYAGDQLEGDAKNSGITLEITIRPKMAGAAPEEGMGEEEHDPIAHAMGMCKGGCAY